MAEIRFRTPQAGDVEAIVGDIREADAAECAALGVTDVAAVLNDCLARSPVSWTGTADGVPVLVMGVTPLHSLLGETGEPWMIGTHLVRRHQWALMRRAPRYIERMLGAFPHLLNFVHAENTVAVGWLKHMGFALDEAAPHGPHGALFHRFQMRAHDPVHLLHR